MFTKGMLQMLLLDAISNGNKANLETLQPILNVTYSETSIISKGNISCLDVKVIVGPEHVAGHDRGELTPVLLIVRPVQYI